MTLTEASLFVVKVIEATKAQIEKLDIEDITIALGLAISGDILTKVVAKENGLDLSSLQKEVVKLLELSRKS